MTPTPQTLALGALTLLLALALVALDPLALPAADGPALGPPVAAAAAPRGQRKRPQRRRRSRTKKRPTEPSPKAAETPDVAAPVASPVLQRSNRMELDARLVRGETPRSGAVYLFQRAPRRLPPLVTLRQSYLDDIVVPVLGPHTGAATEAQAKPAKRARR